MTVRSLCLALAFPVLLTAQNAMLRAQMERGSGEAATAPASLVALDAEGGRTLAEGLRDLLRSEPLQPYEVPLRALTLGSGADRALVARYHLAAKPQWLLVARRGDTVLARGDAPPSAEDLAASLARAGFRDLGRELRTYLKAFPQSLDAREELLRVLRGRAERAAQRLMGVQVPSVRERLQQADLARALREAAAQEADLSRAKPLDPAQDLEAWGAFAQELDTVFKNGQWRELGGEWLREARPLDEASPTLRVLYQRWQPSVEDALRQAPGAEPYWELWLWMSRARGGLALRPLLASMKPSPLTPPGDWPPLGAVRALFASAKSPEDWHALRDHYQGRWEREPHVLKEAGEAPRGAVQEVHRVLLDGDWNTCLGPLLECCLRGGDAFQADALFMEALNGSRWAELPAKASALARRCGQPAVASRWAALRPAAR